MKNILKFAALAAGLAVSASSAMAATFTGYIAVAGGGTFNTTTGAAAPTNVGNSFQGGSGTLGYFDPAISGGVFGVITFSSFSPTTAVGTTILSITTTDSALGLLGAPAATDTLHFTFLSETPGIGGYAAGAAVITGTLSDSAGLFSQQVNATLDFNENALGFNFTQAAISATPEPNSLILMGSGLLSGAGMLFRRRRSIA